MTIIIDGTAIAKKIEKEIQKTLAHLRLAHPSQQPLLTFICVGDHPASMSYIKKKKQKCHEVGIVSQDLFFPNSISEKELIQKIKELNQDAHVHGILVQLPLPNHIDVFKIMEAIDPEKDVDGFHPINMGKLLLGQKDGFIPCTPLGILKMLQESQIDLSGKHVVILGRSNIVGKPLAALLSQKSPEANATVTLAHSYSKNLVKICQSADILVAAIGKAHFVKAEMVRNGSVVIDVGINRATEEAGLGKIVGDVDYKNVVLHCSHISPVPGGVGPMTIAMLLSNTAQSFTKKVHSFSKKSCK